MRRVITLLCSCAFLMLPFHSKAQMCTASGAFTPSSNYGFTGTSDSWGWEGADFSHDPALNRLQSSPANGTKALFSKTLVAPASTLSWGFSLDFNDGTGAVPGYIVFGRYIDEFGNFQELVLCFGAKIVAGNHSFSTTVPPELAGKNFQFHISFNFTGTASSFMAIDNFTTDAVESFYTLPVKFGMFTANSNGDAVQLNWSADVEENTSHYSIERSTDGVQFYSIATAPLNERRIYHYTDKAPLSDAFYRIRSVDHDGRTGYSPVLRVKGKESSVVTRAFINSSNNISVQHESAITGTRIEIYSANGTFLKSSPVVPGSQHTIIGLPSASKGIYFLRYFSGSKTETIKLIKTR